MNNIHQRIAQALDWSEKDVTSFSLATLREMVRPVSPKLAHEITVMIQQGQY